MTCFGGEVNNGYRRTKMNKYTEALLDVRYIYAQSQKYKKLQKYNAKRQLETLQELVDKATPYKIQGNGLCKCGARVLISFQGYCTQCGQALDWSGDD